MQDENKLDNPVWFSLSESHHDFAIDYGAVKFYHPDYCPFGGFENGTNISRCIDEYFSICDNFYIVGEKPGLPGSLKINKELVCLQMVVNDNIEVEPKDEIVRLSSTQHEELYRLINFVQPGYFKARTALLGNYYGIFKNGELIAVTGERMSMNNFTEVSAVVTHPAHTGRGYARQLIAHAINTIIHENKIPYLHVAQHNSIAINLYGKLGFRTRRKISFWNIINAYGVTKL